MFLGDLLGGLGLLVLRMKRVRGISMTIWGTARIVMKGEDGKRVVVSEKLVNDTGVPRLWLHRYNTTDVNVLMRVAGKYAMKTFFQGGLRVNFRICLMALGCHQESRAVVEVVVLQVQMIVFRDLVLFRPHLDPDFILSDMCQSLPKILVLIIVKVMMTMDMEVVCRGHKVATIGITTQILQQQLPMHHHIKCLLKENGAQCFNFGRLEITSMQSQ
jgi:hypothetical protein